MGLKLKQSKTYWKIGLIEWDTVRPAVAVIWMMLCFILKWKGSIFLIKPYFWKNITPITSGFWDIWGYVLEKWGFSLFLRLCTGRKEMFWFFSQMSLFSTTLSLQNELLDSHERFFFPQRYGHIKFWHLSEQPYEDSHWLFGAYHSAFENLSDRKSVV